MRYFSSLKNGMGSDMLSGYDGGYRWQLAAYVEYMNEISRGGVAK